VTSPLDRLMDTTMVCLKCGAPMQQGCECWEKCTCGWFADAGKPCRNPETGRCSTKVKYGKYNRKTKRYE
jgi:hypothetical protein